MPKQWKIDEVKKLKGMIEDNPVVGVISMHKLPAPQLQDMRKELYGDVTVRMSRKNLIRFALDDASKENIKKLEEYLNGEVAFLFTEMNPFSLYKYLQENKSSAPAKPGDIAPKDIVVKKGNTGIDPGPAIGQLQSAGIRTKIQDGKIFVAKNCTVVKEGEEITKEVAQALRMLEVEPMEIGLNILSLWEDGVIFEPSDLRIDVGEYRDSMIATYQQGINLSVNSEYFTEDTAKLIIQKAWRESKSLSISTAFPSKETIKDILRKAYLEAKSLKSKTEEV